MYIMIKQKSQTEFIFTTKSTYVFLSYAGMTGNRHPGWVALLRAAPSSEPPSRLAAGTTYSVTVHAVRRDVLLDYGTRNVEQDRRYVRVGRKEQSAKCKMITTT